MQLVWLLTWRQNTNEMHEIGFCRTALARPSAHRDSLTCVWNSRLAEDCAGGSDNFYLIRERRTR
jgi:hypothetical protein